jgi:hypothetical protein
MKSDAMNEINCGALNLKPPALSTYVGRRWLTGHPTHARDAVARDEKVVLCA